MQEFLSSESGSLSLVCPGSKTNLKRKLSESSQNLIPYYILRNEEPTRKKPRSKLNLLTTTNENGQGRNSVSPVLKRCLGCDSEENFIIDSHEGAYICGLCGVVDTTPIYQELHPNFWGKYSDIDFDTCCPERDSRSKYGPGSTYNRYFHFNEILAEITLTGPWINIADMRIIREEMLNSGIIIDPTKSQIQNACKQINRRYKVRRFSQKYSEKWRQIKWRVAKRKPVEMDRETVQAIGLAFRQMSYCWDDAKHLLNGSKKSDDRKQWPNYCESMYWLVKKRFPNLLRNLKDWLPRLSKKKRNELKPFFHFVFYLLGWE